MHLCQLMIMPWSVYIVYCTYVKQWNVDLTLLNITSTTYVLGDCILSKNSTSVWTNHGTSVKCNSLITVTKVLLSVICFSFLPVPKTKPLLKHSLYVFLVGVKGDFVSTVSDYSVCSVTLPPLKPLTTFKAVVCIVNWNLICKKLSPYWRKHNYNPTLKCQRVQQRNYGKNISF